MNPFGAKLAIIGFTQIALLSACNSDGLEVSQESAQFDWPVTVSQGRIECRSSQQIVFVANGQAYALNGVAQSGGYPAINPIWRDNPEIPGTKISVGPMIALGQDLC